MKANKLFSVDEGVVALQAGNVIAYPTESVFGLGCDPDNDRAIAKVMNLKKRDPNKGFILVAATFEQLLPYIDSEQITDLHKQKLLASWPGPITWIVPKNKQYQALGTQAWTTLAVRVSAHPVVQALCLQFAKPIISTSANISGQTPCKQSDDVFLQFNQDVAVIDGQVGASQKPTEIRDLITDTIIRQG